MTDDLSIREPFARRDQQRRADFLGMYVFIGTEVMLFGALFAAALAYRILEPNAVIAAARHLKLWLGAVNTAVLLTSSLTMAIAVHRGRSGLAASSVRWLMLTAVLGFVFLGIKVYEYRIDYLEGVLPFAGRSSSFSGAELLHIRLYYIATAIHGLHLTLGVLLVVVIACRIQARWTILPDHAIELELVGLYWHFIDVVWVFLYPVLYLPR